MNKTYFFIFLLVFMGGNLSAQNVGQFKNDLDLNGLSGKVREINFRFECDSVFVDTLLDLSLNHAADCGLTGTIRFNIDGNLIYSSLSNGEITTIETRHYNSENNLTALFHTLNDTVQLSTHYFYNQHNILIREEHHGQNSDSVQVIYTYDKRWNLIQADELINGTISKTHEYKYNKKRLVISEKQTDHKSLSKIKYDIQYNQFGQILFVDSDISAASYTYDDMGTIISLYEYNKIYYREFIERTTSYDSIGRPWRIQIKNYNQDRIVYIIDYDHYGNMIRESCYKMNRAEPSEVTNYYHDKDGNLSCYTNDHLYSGDTWLTLVEKYYDYDDQNNWVVETSISLQHIQWIYREVSYY